VKNETFGSLRSNWLQSFYLATFWLFCDFFVPQIFPGEELQVVRVAEMIMEPEWTPASVCILGWCRSQYFKFEPEQESTLRFVEPIKILKGPNF